MKEKFSWRDYDRYNEWLHNVLETQQEEIERLQKDLTYYQEYSADLLNKNNTFENIIKEVREDIIEVIERYNYYGDDNFDLSILSFWVEKLEILDKGE